MHHISNASFSEAHRMFGYLVRFMSALFMNFYIPGTNDREHIFGGVRVYLSVYYQF